MKKIELLAPGGDVDSIKAAIAGGADAVYCGVRKFNARNRAENIEMDELHGIVRLAHKHRCEVFLTLNILIFDHEIPDLIRLLNKMVNSDIDGIIVQDIGLLYILKEYFPSLNVHASTQLTTHNEGQLKFLKHLGVSRVNLCRELSLGEITSLCSAARENNLLVEVFVHGSYCISFSGLCYLSFTQNGNSGNRGRCSQPCRDKYLKTPSGAKHPLNLKDNCAFANIKELYDAGVDSIKIEGRIKKYHYVYSVVSAYREQLERLYAGKDLKASDDRLQKSFNRDFTTGFLDGSIGMDMFIDNPRDQSETSREEFGNVKEETKQIISELSTEKEAVKISFRGTAGSPLRIDLTSRSSSFSFSSESTLSVEGSALLTENELRKRLKGLNDTGYYLESLDFEHMEDGLHLPYRELNILKNKVLCKLRNNREQIPEVKLERLRGEGIKCLQSESEKSIPWFSAILIDDDFVDAVESLKKISSGVESISNPSSENHLHPKDTTGHKKIITENTGIAYEAYKLGIPWIAGPQMNISNSYSLLALKQLGCVGAFFSPDLSEKQISKIVNPGNFEFYSTKSLRLPLMTSRACLYQSVVGCKKSKMDDDCLPNCNKSASIKDEQGRRYVVEKKPGEYWGVYSW